MKIKKTIDHVIASIQITQLASKQAKANGFKEPISSTLKLLMTVLKCK